MIGSTLFAADGDGQKYAIKLDRPSKVGDQFKVDVIGATQEKMQVAIEGEEPRTVDATLGIQASGTAKLLELSPAGNATKLNFTIEKCTATVGKESHPLLPKGTVLVVAWDKERFTTTYTLDGTELPPQIADLMELVIETNDPESVGDDALFGTNEKRQVGDTWALNASAAAKELARVKLNAKEEDLFGECTLTEQVSVNKVPCLVVKTFFKVRSLTGTGRQPDAKMQIDKGNMTNTVTITFPVDPKFQPVKAEAKLVIDSQLSGTSDDGKKVKATRYVERLSERTLTPIVD